MCTYKTPYDYQKKFQNHLIWCRATIDSNESNQLIKLLEMVVKTAECADGKSN